MDTQEFGERIRALRQERDMTLQDLSDASGLSPSFLSQIERGQSSVTIMSLQKIADALEIAASTFLDPPKPKTSVTRRDQRQQVGVEGAQATYHTLAGEMERRQFDPLVVEIEPRKGKHKALPYSHRGEEFGYVLEGELTMIVDDEEYTLQPGDAIHLKSSVPHTWDNRTDETVVVLWIITPTVF